VKKIVHFNRLKIYYSPSTHRGIVTSSKWDF